MMAWFWNVYMHLFTPTIGGYVYWYIHVQAYDDIYSGSSLKHYLLQQEII